MSETRGGLKTESRGKGRFEANIELDVGIRSLFQEVFSSAYDVIRDSPHAACVGPVSSGSVPEGGISHKSGSRGSPFLSERKLLEEKAARSWVMEELTYRSMNELFIFSHTKKLAARLAPRPAN